MFRNSRAKYKRTQDPTIDDVRKLCTSTRRMAKTDRALIHYNGHGVPRPTLNGEIWVFNRVRLFWFDYVLSGVLDGKVVSPIE